MNGDIDSLELGGKITLIGFREVEPSKLIVVKKVVGNFAKKLQEKSDKFENLSVHIKPVHSSGHEINTKAVINGKVYNTENTNFNLFFALNSSLSALVTEIEKDL